MESQCDLSVTFDFGSTKTFSTDICKTYFSYYKDIRFLASYCMYFRLILPFTLTDMLQLIKDQEKFLKLYNFWYANQCCHLGN